MNTLIDTPRSAQYRMGHIEIEMQSGRKFRFPVTENPRLREASDAERADIEISPFGLHWPRIDEDLSIRGIMAGDFGQRKAGNERQ